ADGALSKFWSARMVALALLRGGGGGDCGHPLDCFTDGATGQFRFVCLRGVDMAAHRTSPAHRLAAALGVFVAESVPVRPNRLAKPACHHSPGGDARHYQRSQADLEKRCTSLAEALAGRRGGWGLSGGGTSTTRHALGTGRTQRGTQHVPLRTGGN